MVVKDAEQIVYNWNGERTSDGRGWVEHFAAGGKGKRLPPRDLTAADVDSFTDAQRALLESEAGQRLYTPAEKTPKRGGSKSADKGADSGNEGGE